MLELDKEGLLSLEDLEKNDKALVEKIMEETRLNKDEIEEIVEIDLEDKELQKCNIKQSMNPQSKVTNKESLEQLLGIQNENYRSIAVIYSDNMEGNTNTSRFSFVGIDKDGNCHKIDNLIEKPGRVMTQDTNMINRDGSEVENQNQTSIYSIKGKSEEGLSIRIGDTGTIETSFTRTARQAGEETLAIPIENVSTRRVSKDIRDVASKEKNTEVKTETTIFDESYISNYTYELLENDEIASKFNFNDVKNRVTKSFLENHKIDDIEEIKKIAEESILHEAEITNVKGL